jgi:hypothetical protein
MQTDGSVYLITKEAKNGRINGLFKLLDELSAYWNWNKTKITIESSLDAKPYSDYILIYNNFCHPHAVFDTTSKIYPWNKEKYYGMFIGRANSSRIRAIHNHKNFKYVDKGLTSFNEDLFNYMSYPNLVEYFFHSNQTYNEMLSVKPYSDIKHLVDSPGGAIIPPPHNSSNWSKVYEKIAIEIVCETSTEDDCFSPSEKILRPCYYKRPFLVIGSPNFLQEFRKLGYKTFNGIIDESYDQYSAFTRVDSVFNILHNLIESQEIDTLLERCADILEHNHQWIIDDCQRQLGMQNEYNTRVKNAK